MTAAIGKADKDNLAALPEIVGHVYCKLPARCWGSAEKVEAWLTQEGQAARSMAAPGGSLPRFWLNQALASDLVLA